MLLTLKRHANSKLHIEAVNASNAPAGSPPTSFFTDLVDHIQTGAGSAPEQEWAHLRGTWCLAEALKAMDQRFLARARAVTLFRDERKGRLMIRFLAVGPDLEVRSGTFGQEQGHGTGAINILKATENVLLRACTRFATPPYRCRAQPVLNRKLYRHLRLAVTGITTDAAADEVLGAELMRSPELLSRTRALCPNLQHVLRDKTHASRRLSSRPYGADPYLRDVLLMFATGRTSPARMVQHSMEARRVFRGFVHTSTHPEVKKGSH